MKSYERPVKFAIFEEPFTQTRPFPRPELTRYVEYILDTGKSNVDSEDVVEKQKQCDE